MTHREAIRYLVSLATMLDNERTLAELRGTAPQLLVTAHLAERIASACDHAVEWLATLPEGEESDAD